MCCHCYSVILAECVCGEWRKFSVVFKEQLLLSSAFLSIRILLDVLCF